LYVYTNILYIYIRTPGYYVARGVVNFFATFKSDCSIMKQRYILRYIWLYDSITIIQFITLFKMFRYTRVSSARRYFVCKTRWWTRLRQLDWNIVYLLYEFFSNFFKFEKISVRIIWFFSMYLPRIITKVKQQKQLHETVTNKNVQIKI